MFESRVNSATAAHHALANAAQVLQVAELQPFAAWVEVDGDTSVGVCKEDLRSQLEGLLHRFAQERYPDADRAATVSQWSTDYFCATLVPLLGFALVAQAKVADGKPALYRLNGSAIQALIIDHCLDPLIGISPEDHICHTALESEAGFVSALASAGQVSERLLWTNLIIVLEALCAALKSSERFGSSADRLWERLSATTIPGHRYQAGTLLRELPAPATDLPTPWRIRRICCLHYRLNDTAPLCTSCPLLLRRSTQEQADYLLGELRQQN